MGLITITTSSDGQAETIAPTSNSLITIANEINGNLDDANIKSTANINGSKLLNASIPYQKLQGAWTTFNPIWTSTSAPFASIGNGTIAGKYIRFGNMITGRVRTINTLF